MKHWLIISLTLFIFACGGESGEESNRGEERSNNNSEISDSTTVSDAELDEPSRNDWDEEDLKGEVQRLSTHGSDMDEDGNEIGMGGYDDVLEFDEEGHIISSSSNGCCGMANTEIEYKRDSEGKLTHRIFRVVEPWEDITDETPFDHKEKYFYKEGVLVKMKIAGADSVLTEEHEYEYDDQGRLIKEKVSFEEDTENFTRTFKYEEGKRTESVKYEEAKNDYKYIYYYNEDGLLTHQEMHYDDGVQEVRFTYKFDDSGNWIEKKHEYRFTNKDGEKDDWMYGYRENRKINYF